MGSTPVLHSVLNVKALVGASNQEKALVGAFSVIVKTGCGTDGSFYITSGEYAPDVQIVMDAALPRHDVPQHSALPTPATPECP